MLGVFFPYKVELRILPTSYNCWKSENTYTCKRPRPESTRNCTAMSCVVMITYHWINEGIWRKRTGKEQMSTKGRVNLGRCIHIKENIIIRDWAKSGSTACPAEKRHICFRHLLWDLWAFSSFSVTNLTNSSGTITIFSPSRRTEIRDTTKNEVLCVSTRISHPLRTHTLSTCLSHFSV